MAKHNSRFDWKYWQFTGSDESLFDLTADELRMFKQFVRLSLAYTPPQS
jgi:hypothetical protein